MSEQSTNTGKMGPWTAGLLALAAVLSFGLATLLEFWRGDTQSEVTEQVIAERYDKLAQLKDGMTKEVNTYRWVKKPEGIVQLPIDVAMKATLKDLQARKPGPSGVSVDPAAAAAPPTPANPEAAEPAPAGDEKAAKEPEAPKEAVAPEAEAPATEEQPKTPAPGTEEAQA